MVSVHARVQAGGDSTFFVLFVLKVSDDLSEQAAVLVAQLLVCSHVGRREPGAEVCHRSGKPKCVLRRLRETNRKLRINLWYVRHEFLITVIFTKHPKSVHDLVVGSSQKKKWC